MGAKGLPIDQVWRALGGAELRHGRGRAFYRGGDNPGSVLVKADRFYDFVTHQGGDAIALVRLVMACSYAEALGWLEVHGFIAPQGRL